MELRMEHLYKFYRKKEALHDVDVTLQTGVYALLGENGAEKSTLMRIMSTVDCPSKGTIRCNGRDIFEMDEEYRDLIGYIPQDYRVYPEFTARDFLEYMGILKSILKHVLKTRISEVLEIVNRDDVVFITALSKKVMQSAAVDIFF